MDFDEVNNLANKYLFRFENGDFRDDYTGKSFEWAFQSDLREAGFKVNYHFNSDITTEEVDAIKDIQTVGDTILSQFRFAVTHMVGWASPEWRDWYICALQHLSDLTDDELYPYNK